MSYYLGDHRLIILLEHLDKSLKTSIHSSSVSNSRTHAAFVKQTQARDEVGRIKPLLSLSSCQIHKYALHLVWWTSYCSRWDRKYQRLLMSFLQLPCLRYVLMLECKELDQSSRRFTPVHPINWLSTVQIQSKVSTTEFRVFILWSREIYLFRWVSSKCGAADIFTVKKDSLGEAANTENFAFKFVEDWCQIRYNLYWQGSGPILWVDS